MKKILLFAAAAMFFTLATYAQKDSIKLISFNIRFDYDADGVNAWSNRKQATKNMIEQEKPDIFGLQEALKSQLDYIDKECSEYKHVGVGRDDGKEQGETMAVYYLKDKYRLIEWKTFWLSQTPDVPSKGWDAACRRTVTYVYLENIKTKQRLCYYNTHLDHMGDTAREESVKLLCKIIAENTPKGVPAILGGDMNSSAADEIFEPFKDYGLKQARKTSPVTDRKQTFNGWGSAPNSIVIDHIYYKGNIVPKQFRTLNGNYGAQFISDHYPIEFVFAID